MLLAHKIEPASENLHWSFVVPTPFGDTHLTYVISDEALQFESDDPLTGCSVTIRWDAIKEGETASLALMGNRSGAPQMAAWIPDQMEVLALSQTSAGGKPFFEKLPQGPERDAIVAAVKNRLGSRWIGEGASLLAVQEKLGLSPSGETIKVIGIVIAVLALLCILLIILMFLFIPLVLIIGGWLFYDGLSGVRDAIALSNTPPSKVNSAAVGLVEMEGRAVTNDPSPAGITGRPSVWWDVYVSVWKERSGNKAGSWQQVASRHGGTIDVVILEDDTGQIPIWLKDAKILLKEQSWESDADILPTDGMALLDEFGFPWSNTSRKIKVREVCLEVNGALGVLGTLDERGSVIDASPATGFGHLLYLARTGEWRRKLIKAIPGRPAKSVVATLIAYFQLLKGVGGDVRQNGADTTPPPSLGSSELLVWKGRSGRPFLVSDGTGQDAVGAWRKSSLRTAGVGAFILCFFVFELLR